MREDFSDEFDDPFYDDSFDSAFVDYYILGRDAGYRGQAERVPGCTDDDARLYRAGYADGTVERAQVNADIPF